MTRADPTPLTLKLPGRRAEQPALPRALQASQRGVAEGGSDDPFLPRGWVRPLATVELSPAARAVDPAAEQTLAPAAGQVLAIELADGVTVYTSPANLQRTLERVAPDAVAADGSLALTALEDRAGATRAAGGAAAGALIARVTTLEVGGAGDAITEAAARQLRAWLGDRLVGEALDQLGLSWWGTKALMWAIEDRHGRTHGLYRWLGGEAQPSVLFAPQDDPRLAKEAGQGPALLFIHGTASSVGGSFGDLQQGNPATWRALEQQYGERIYGFEHRSLSESPIENALQLARALPAGARLHLVSHSRGGQVGDLMCLAGLDTPEAAALIEAYAVDAVALGAVDDPADRERLRAELEQAYAAQRAALRELAAVLRAKGLVVERYVRVASPARGTRLASGNFDVFLSGLLTLVGLVPGLAGNPWYSALKRLVLEIAKNRTRPQRVPGIESMLPESPMARLLARAPAQAGTAMAVIAGDIEGGSLLKRLGVLFTDHMFFDGVDNDLVVDTDSMSAGVARPERTRRLFDQGPEVNHFHYFSNPATREPLRLWLTTPDPLTLPQFGALPGLPAERSAADTARRDSARAATRGLAPATLPVVLVLPGVMGSHLWVDRRDRVWLDPIDLLAGGLEKVAFGRPGVEAEKLFDLSYGDLCEHLAASHQVERCPYDWRLPLDQLADALALRLRAVLDASAQPLRPVRVVAHSMGGLVVRALVARHAALWDELMQRPGARLVMLGTPNHGSHQMVEMLIGKGDTVRMLGRADLKHSLQQVLDLVGGFRGPLSLLPRPGFKDEAAILAGAGQQLDNYFDPAVWATFKRELRDLWFGDGVVAGLTPEALAGGRWLWDHAGAEPALPARYADRVYYVHGVAARTACGIVKRNGRWQMLATPRGDGTVSWASGKLAAGVAAYYYMPASHGALADTPDYFDAIRTLLSDGQPGKLLSSPPRTRDAAGAEPPPLLAYDAGPPIVPGEAELVAALQRRTLRAPARAAATGRSLAVQVRAMDLRGVDRPILVGHYAQDAISGAEAVIDRALVDGALRQRYDLGLYAGALGTATVVLPRRNAMERGRGSRRGAVVAGLGAYDGTLAVPTLTEAVRTATLRYLLQLLDNAEALPADEAEAGVPLASLLLGYNSAANLSLGDCVGALVRGVAEANRKFQEATGQALHVNALEIVEVYLDTAISATRALQALAPVLDADRSLRCRISAAPTLAQGEGVRQRLADSHGGGYWARLVVTDADRREDAPGDAAPTAPAPGAPDAGAAAAAPPARALAQRLRYLYLGGQRARAETEVQQRQPGLVETLVARQIHQAGVQPELGRTLFRLLVPHEMKDTLRQLDRAVLLLDGTTANLPWELMWLDDEPLAVRAALVRQLSSTRFRPQVRQAAERRALVIGNPSSAGFGAAFSLPGEAPLADPPPLPGAEQEAETVVDTLRGQGWQVERRIGSGQPALEVVSTLLAQPWRVLHIAAHGVVEQPHRDGQARTGVVLSDGLLITAAEVGAMDSVPELVFLNCCHLGQADARPTAYNRLAYSLARELIEIGVRAVVVAGWAVDDSAAALFAQTFYTALLAGGQPLGDAAHQARRAVWTQMPQCNTWGAYQVYGEPGWRLAPQAEGAAAAPEADSWRPVAPEELLAELALRRRAVAALGAGPGPGEVRAVVAGVDALLARLPEPAWRERPDVAAAVARLLADLGPAQFDAARRWYLRALADPAGLGAASLEAVEQLANLEARLGEARDDLALVDSAIARLHSLLGAAAADPGAPTQAPVAATGAHAPDGAGAPAPAGPATAPNAERAGLLGSAYKRRAAVLLRRAAADDAEASAAISAALAEAARWYRAGAGPLDSAQPYAALNWLFLAGFAPGRVKAEEAAERLALAERCGAAANAAHGRSRSFWDAMMAADAQLVLALLQGQLAGAGRNAEVARLASVYAQARAGVAVPPKGLDSVATQMRLLAGFHRQRGGRAGAATAESLAALADRLQPAGAG